MRTGLETWRTGAGRIPHVQPAPIENTGLRADGSALHYDRKSNVINIDHKQLGVAVREEARKNASGEQGVRAKLQYAAGTVGVHLERTKKYVVPSDSTDEIAVRGFYDVQQPIGRRRKAADRSY